MGFAGGFTLGAVQAGFELQAKWELPPKPGFGSTNCLANRHLLGHKWEVEISAGDWEPFYADAVFGNPPCSGWSLLSRKDFRGRGSPVEGCMWKFIGGVARVRPQIAIMESVAQAYRQGSDLMRDLHAKLEAETGEDWQLTHVLHNAASVGGAAIRRRYFMVVSRVPFGIEAPNVAKVPTLDDVIGDLENLARTWRAQPYRCPPSWWARERRSDSYTVDGHQCRDTPLFRRALDLMRGVPWLPKEHMSQVCRKYYETHGRLPESWQATEAKVVANDFQMGYNQMIRWRGDRVSRVITGGGPDLVLHPHLDRLLTHREVARIMGFPDTWLIDPIRRAPGLQLTWGKGIPVDCGRWIAGWARAAIEERPGRAPAARLGEREWLYDVTDDYRRVCWER
jgi:site-specific DNA-cytosine methylase